MIANTTAVKPEIVEHILLSNVSWEMYERLLASFGDRRFRHTYDHGVLEIMSPLKRHEWVKSVLGRMVEMTSYELQIEIQSIGSTTLRKRKKMKGLEPDECYYVQHEAVVRHLDDYEPERDPPPDLAIEVHVSYADLSRESVYAGLGVPEIWHFDSDTETLRILSLKQGKYVKINKSRAFPVLTSRILSEFVARRSAVSENTVIREFVAWLKKQSSK